MMTYWYEMDAPQALRELKVEESLGLSQEEVVKRQEEHGKNQFAPSTKVSLFQRILHQLKDVSTIVLLIAAALSFGVAIYEGSSLLEPLVILAIVVLNVALAITQEGKAEKALEALEDMNAPTCVVLRDGVRQSVDTLELVPGDIVVLETGNIIPADARLLTSVGLCADESSLTGESEPAEKDAEALLLGDIPLGDQQNVVFSGCVVTGGHGTAVVTATGMDTQMGQIAGYLHNEVPMKTPLQVRLDKLGRMISWIAIIAALFLLAAGLRSGTDLSTMVMVAISLAVAAVPETLSLIVTLSLTGGVQKMVKKNALIRKLPAVETLGSTSVICSDKTGTLTQNRMTVKKLWLYGWEPVSAKEKLDEQRMQFLTLLAMASNATVETDESGEVRILGNATEVGIMRLLYEKGSSKVQAERERPKVAEIPFSSDRKRMTVVLEDKQGGYIVLTKGALDRLPLAPLPQDMAQAVKETHDSFAKQALRVIALACKHIDTLPQEGHMEELEEGMTLMGLVGLIDPPRPEAAAAIEKARRAGIRTIMITGDHAATAGAIASEIGILTEGQKVISGTQLAHMSDVELNDTVRNYSVYARVSPEDKIRIVKAWQQNGEVVAMTGDGVNDAPALKAADVGIAMGKAGTEVAKNASDMILTDDNFATIVDAVSEGRNVYENIRKTIYFLLVCNLSEIVIMLFAQMAGWGILLTPVMLLLINLLGDGIPGLQLAYENSDEDVMARKPVERDENFFSGDLLRNILRQTLICSIVSLAAYYIGANWGLSPAGPTAAIGQTMAFLTVGWTSILHIFNVRSRNSVFKTPLRTNLPLAYSAAGMLLVMGLLVATPLGNVFGLTSIGGLHWLVVVGLSIIPTLVRELGRLADRRATRKAHRCKGKEEAIPLA